MLHRKFLCLLAVLAVAGLQPAAGAEEVKIKHGGLTLNGTPDNPVTITCAKPECAAGDWHRIDLEDGSVTEHNVFRNAIIQYGGGSNHGQLNIEEGASVTLENVSFSNSGNDGCDIDDANEWATTTFLGTNTYEPCP